MTRNPLFHNWLCIGLIAAMTGGCRPSTDLEMYGKFQAAQAAFDIAKTSDDFRRVAAMYQEILDSGFVSGAVLYNQGNAFMRAGMRGRAVASYRQASRYRPRDPYLDANLRSALGGQLTAPSRPLIEYVFFWQNWISYPGKFRLSLYSAALTFGCAICGVWFRKKWLRRTSAVILVVTTLVAFSAIYDWYRFGHTRHGVIVAAEVLARKGNGESYKPAFNQPLEEATEFIVVEERGGWIHVRLGKEKEGWIPEAAATLY